MVPYPWGRGYDAAHAHPVESGHQCRSVRAPEVRREIDPAAFATYSDTLIEAIDERIAISPCKKVRNDQGYWLKIEEYLSRHTGARLTHGYCAECAARTLSEAGLESAPGGPPPPARP